MLLLLLLVLVVPVVVLVIALVVRKMTCCVNCNFSVDCNISTVMVCGHRHSFLQAFGTLIHSEFVFFFSSSSLHSIILIVCLYLYESSAVKRF